MIPAPSCNLWIQTDFSHIRELEPSQAPTSLKWAAGPHIKLSTWKYPLQNPREPILNVSKAELIISLQTLCALSVVRGTLIVTMSQLKNVRIVPRLFPPLKQASFLPPCPYVTEVTFPQWLASFHISCFGSLCSGSTIGHCFCQAPSLQTLIPAIASPLVPLGFRMLLC